LKFFKTVIPNFFLILLLSGCAATPWLTPLKEKEFDSKVRLVTALSERYSSCDRGFQSDLAIFFNTPYGQKALNGFLQFSQPASYKFVATNPFGQPLFIIAGNKQDFQAIIVPDKQYIAGSIRSFLLRNHLPIFFLKGRWGEWLTGRAIIKDDEITAIREDKDKRGFWVTVSRKNTTTGYTTHLLFDPKHHVFLEEMLENGVGKIVAEIVYDNRSARTGCQQPSTITISGLDYGTEIRLELTDIRSSDTQKKYILSTPKGYYRQYMP